MIARAMAILGKERIRSVNTTLLTNEKLLGAVATYRCFSPPDTCNKRDSLSVSGAYKETNGIDL